MLVLMTASKRGSRDSKGEPVRSVPGMPQAYGATGLRAGGGRRGAWAATRERFAGTARGADLVDEHVRRTGGGKRRGGAQRDGAGAVRSESGRAPPGGSGGADGSPGAVRVPADRAAGRPVSAPVAVPAAHVLLDAARRRSRRDPADRADRVSPAALPAR